MESGALELLKCELVSVDLDEFDERAIFLKSMPTSEVKSRLSSIGLRVSGSRTLLVMRIIAAEKAGLCDLESDNFCSTPQARVLSPISEIHEPGYGAANWLARYLNRKRQEIIAGLGEHAMYRAACRFRAVR